MACFAAEHRRSLSNFGEPTHELIDPRPPFLNIWVWKDDDGIDDLCRLLMHVLPPFVYNHIEPFHQHSYGPDAQQLDD